MSVVGASHMVIVAHSRMDGLAGACIGVNAALISIITEWLSDLKMGYCKDGWWLNKEFCCWEIPGNERDRCEAWQLWSQMDVGIWVIYTMFAVSQYFITDG